MATAGLKDPCYCGSGRSFGECCLKRDYMELQSAGEDILGDDFPPGLEVNSFGSVEEAKNEIQRIVDEQNRTARDAFCGLSPEEMFHLLHQPFSSPGIVAFNLDIQHLPDSPFLRLFLFLINAAAKDGLKATAKGMLPVQLVRDAAPLFYGEKYYQQRLRYMSFRTETDISELHTVRKVAELSGFLRKVKGRFQLTKAGSALAKTGMNGASFLKVFETYTQKFNWGYNDRYRDMEIVQHTCLFTLYMLSRFGTEIRPVSFYENRFVAAFPDATRTVESSPYNTQEETLKRCYSLRALERFAQFFGFIEVEGAREARWIEKQQIRKTAFLDAWVRFTVGGVK